MTNQGLEEQVRSVISSTFALREPVEDLRMGAVPGWDSMGHMDLVMALEKEFDLAFTTADIARLVDVGAVCRIIRRARGA